MPVIRAYLKRWKFEVGVFFDGVGPESSDDEIRAIAARHPAFEVLPADEDPRVARVQVKACPVPTSASTSTRSARSPG